MPAYNTYKSTMKKNTFLILSLLLLYLYPLSASVEIRSNKLTTGDGLANNSTRYMMQDSKGFIWLGTLNGLSYYDGNSFVNIYPDINNPLSLADSLHPKHGRRPERLHVDFNNFFFYQLL